MVSIFDSWIYSLSFNRDSTHFCFSIVRKIVKLVANIILPWYLFLKLLKFKKSRNVINHSIVIVSLTSFPRRINKAWISIASILLQNNPPDRVILWLSSEEFTSLNSLPKSLLKLQSYGLEIKFCSGNMFGHKKYFHIEPDMKSCIFITVDDDVIYRNDLIDSLLDTYNNNINSVCATIAHKVVPNGKSFLPYSKWPSAKDFEVGNLVFPVGAGAVLYPPNFFDNFLFESETVDEICLFADDIWLFVVSRYMGFNSTKSNYKSSYIPILYFKNSTLFQTNIGLGKNDTQISDVVKYFSDKKTFDLYSKLEE
jgi:hypothetical protein